MEDPDPSAMFGADGADRPAPQSLFGVGGDTRPGTLPPKLNAGAGAVAPALLSERCIAALSNSASADEVESAGAGAPPESLTGAAGLDNGNGGGARSKEFGSRVARTWSAKLCMERSISDGDGDAAAAAAAIECHILATEATSSASADGAGNGVGSRVDIEGGG